MSTGATTPVPAGSPHPDHPSQDVPLTEDEATYVAASRTPNTLRGYRSDWNEFSTWCRQRDADPLPAGPATISGYLTELARAGAKVGTISRRLSAIRIIHQLDDLPTRPAPPGSSPCGKASAAPTAPPPTRPLR